MKRGKPLKRTPLKRGSSQLKRTPLKKRSDKMSEKYVERRSTVQQLLSERSHCEACLVWASYDYQTGKSDSLFVKHNRSKDIHELVNRSQGGSILELENLLAVCRPCHNRITTEPLISEMLGLHLKSTSNKMSHFLEAERVRNAWKNGTSAEPSWFSTD